MSTNNALPHLLVLPEDDKNRQILVGFRSYFAVDFRRMRVEKIANGWRRAVETFLSDHVGPMRRFPDRHLLLVIDFDQQPERREEILERVPDDLRDRVYVIGSLDEPERLLASMRKNAEKLGEALAEDCSRGTDENWRHEMLAHNEGELSRLRTNVRHFLFTDAEA
jgi:hypothetical protein